MTGRKTRSLLMAALLAVAFAPDARADGSRLSSAPKKVLGVVVGAFVGTPIAAVRRTIDEQKYGVANIDKGSQKPRVKIPTEILWLPFSACAGAFAAPWVAMGNSALNYDKPFSKAQFSLVDTPQAKPTVKPQPEYSPNEPADTHPESK